MAVKYTCPECGRRFVEWGAKKLDFKCPGETCNDAKLALPGENEEKKEEKPTLKRSRKRTAVVSREIVELDKTSIASKNTEEEEEEEEAEEEAEAKNTAPAVDITIITPSDVKITVPDIIPLEDDSVEEEETDDTFTKALDINDDNTST
ncbi:MAG: hypothetical protein KAH38_09725 [Candidatus Hydrogenedentes bacterium]|nr:hypothetical protein [Candidatus Hydrogenedentota bacterium]